MYMQMSWVEANKAAPLWMHIAVNVGVIFLSIVLAGSLLKLYDEPVREGLNDTGCRGADEFGSILLDSSSV